MSGAGTAGGAPLVLGLGEALVRLSPPGQRRLEVATELELEIGGAELNALIGAARWGARARWLSRLADNPLGRRIAAHARAHGVETEVAWDPAARAPLYFVEHGAEPRQTHVLYDRERSAMAALAADGFAWEEAVAGAGAVLCSGITCGLGPGTADAARAFLAAGRAAGARTFFDVNHRSRVWSWERAAPVLREVLGGVDVLFASPFDLARLLEREGEPEELARAASERFGHELVVMRENGHERGRVAVEMTAVSADGVERSERHEAQVVDGFGGGDVALGVFVVLSLGGAPLAAALDSAARACALQHTIPGDAWIGSPAE
ncbi:MAG TPA: PfkB family carbohydrate kinase, partial [Solirubrobacterales bacterium]|nr:PfkB family carbohydrate kinase [Solirubrobacterales bacterium]